MNIFLINFCLVAISWLPVTEGQTTYFDEAAISSEGDNLVYLLLIVFFSINFFTPVLYWLLRNYVQKWLDKAQDRLVEIQQRVTERLGDASRKFSDKVRS